MSIKSFPFTSEVTYDTGGKPIYDRAVDSKILRTVYKNYWNDGVFALNDSTCFQVIAPVADSMSVIVKKGACQIQGASAYSETDITLEIERADQMLPRVDTVVLRLDDNLEYRNIRLAIVKGIPASNPVVPTLTRTDSIYELGIANVLVGTNISAIKSIMITDTRQNVSRCGYVTSIQQIDVGNLYQQFQGSIDEIISTMRDALDETLAGNLQNQIDALENKDSQMQTSIDALTADSTSVATTSKLGKVMIGTSMSANSSGVLNVKPATVNALGGIKVGNELVIDGLGVLGVKKPTSIYATLYAGIWTGSKPYFYQLPVTGVTPTSTQDIMPHPDNMTEELYDMFGGAKIFCHHQENEKIILKSLGEKPTSDLPIEIVLRGEK